MSKMIVLVISFLGLLNCGVGQIIQSGQCETIQPNPNFNPENFLVANFTEGKWFEFRRSENVYQSGDCATVEFSEANNGYQISYLSVNANFLEESNSTAVHTNGTATFTINAPSVSYPIEVTVIRTDYTSYAVAYSCRNINGNQRALTVWELLRQQDYPNAMIPALIITTLSVGFGITVDDLRSIDHSDAACYELPVIPLGQPVILPGSCNLNIPVVQNFNVSAFGGLWHETSAYFSESSQNRCSRAEYTLLNGVVQVQNSQVINQALSTISGTATPLGNDQSARLSVVLNVGTGTVTSELWVLATDYENYAVSYSCENLPNNQQRVYSWILSRSRQLSAESQTAVNRLIASQVVLNDAYYRRTDQSDEACFFFPEVNPSRPVVFRGQCSSNIQAIADFNPVAYQGIWHDIESYPSVFQNGACRNAEYTLDNVTLVVDVLNTQVIGDSLDIMRGEAVLASNDGSGILNVTFPVAGTNINITTNYWVLDTDYNSYSLVYSCLNLNEDEQQVWIWKLSRSKQLSQEASTAINTIMSNYTILDQRYFVPVDQTVNGCFYYPEPQPGVPVIFPGQCDPNVSVVPNFNLNQFNGTWYEIQAYPKDQQQGQCISHEYTPGVSNTLDLTSSQVIDQFLSVSEGLLSFNSTDNSARMTINIIVNGEEITIPFWILNTDYNDYALAYSCVNRGQDFRAIYSWKLSRTRALSSNAIININNTISSIEVLGEEYYESIDQSLDACFFLPELAPGEPVILVGQCDPNITVVQDFNATRYLGTWRLIESYPNDFQSGTCNQANYGATSLANTVSVLNTQVINQTLATTTGGQAVASADGSGRLLVTFASSTQPQELWILDTDYDSYSLVYSCSNIDNERRRVWSWKMSRTRELSSTAISAIDQVVNSVQVLNHRYYYTVKNSDEACFYFPEPDFSVSGVLFRGTCDQNISVVQNFSVERYLGTWRNVELYPSNFQTGSCNTAQYSLGNGFVVVRNTQVVNQSLASIEGSAVVTSDDLSAKLMVSFPGLNGAITETPIWVLATDYDSYSLTYTCVDVDDDYRRVWSWKLSKTRELSPNAVTAIREAASNIDVLAPQYYRSADHTADGCFYYPEPVPQEPVRFTGQCNNNISVVQNFNLTGFEGTWHEIEAYPKREQQGECVNHQYSAGAANTLNLQSFNVINQSLGVTDGIMRFTSTDNSARMSITINNNGTDIIIPFWIVDTDYTDYALAYACENDGPDYRYVYSWKLSRTKVLSANARVAINDAIANVDVLANQYYEEIDQSDRACFYLPEVGPGEEVVFPGQCENIPVVQNFRAADYTGRWFLIESYPAVHQSGTCNDATYTPGANNVINVRNTQVVNQTLASASGTAVPASNDGSGRLLVTIGSSTTPSELWILDTDYTSYSLVYSCRNINSDQRAVWSWKLSRTRALTQNATEAINEVIDSVNVLHYSYYYQIDRSEQACFYFPEPDLSRPVRFRGRCNTNVTAMQNFNATRYLGVWHNIELYPTSFQGGACNNALYTLGADGVVVFNTQVVNQNLATITGLAVPTYNDGSAILDVTFPTTNQTTPYWVLATDYDSYSLVYSCVPIDEEYTNVWSWKLSRTRQLPNEALAAIDNAISQVEVLDSRYYRTADQSPEACFYYPEPQPGVPVRFPGRCDNNIPVEPNFNLTMFEGVWHEIQAYPKEQQQGQCINHEYSAGIGNTLNLISSSVSNLTLGLTNGTLRFTSTDNSARLSITITNSNGQEVTIPFWILDTDYDDYALAYACVDEERENDMDYRRVFSWKLSRTRSLSSGGNAAINAVINATDVLNNIYYEDIDQSNNACFFLPDILPGEPVIFPGQCESDVPVVETFNATAYLGRWRTVELYHADFNTGECSEATYTPNANGNVNVLNTHVIDQTLFSASGVAVPASDGSGRLEVTFSNSATSSIYWVLATDYDSYALVYTCRNINAEQRRVGAWKLSRDRVLSADAITSIDQTIDRVNVLDNRYFRSMAQNDAACFYYPEADGSPVIFRGQCDDNITVFSNFNASRYEGTWYDIESYPAGFQSGTCNTATYTLNGGIVEVVNTQVVDQELATIRATAVPATADGSGKLIVTFPAGPNATIDVPYWVLETDYESFSLVYSCQNVDNESRRVTSWKLSRTQYLTNDSNAAIEATMSNVPVLRQQYYLQRSHTFDDCFFYPDNFGGPVIFNDGQCPTDDQVNAITSFDADRFTGQWHEVERFPTELQSGACASSVYSIGANGSSTLTQTIVYNERELTLTGSAIVANNGRGIIAVRLNNSEVDINTNLYVIDTDYTGYALLYACRTLSATSRQVYSWKLSRTRAGLSASEVNEINTIVRREVDLHRSYYETTAQDNDACFFYPVFDELPNSIQMPGPCPNIPAVANFNVSAFLGRWYDVERYPQPNQRGTCNRARYTELTATSFGVYNYQVLASANGPTLSSISGDATITSTDGSGGLTVTLQNGQRVRTLSVLQTDYENFALLYNCRNLDNGWRQVASWKFGRSTSLSTASQNAINAVMSRTQGLTQEYFVATNQTEEACFFVPAFNPNQRPQFRARCESISGMQQFNINRYAGWWHEFESYATETERGDCVSAQYTTSGSTAQYVGTGVFGLTAQVTTGSVTVGENGRLTKTLSNGQVQNLWVLDTDYDTYSVVISCEPVDDEFIHIWSAKYRKTFELTEQIINATNAVVESHPLLDQRLYQAVNQSDEACFHYPATVGSRVVLRGQCDLSIPVQNDFQISEYTGTWYQIERYPYEDVRDESTCIGARYALVDDTDVVSVLNWEVYDGELETIEGLATVVGNARLQVQIPVPDSNQTSTTDLYILSTDYVSYSLAYTCVNINDFQRAVVAFKLSRTRALPAAAESTINTIVGNRPELHQPYFNDVTQNDECEEPSSSYLIKSSILLVLLCYAIQILM